MTKFRILLADDHETVRAGLRLILSAQPDMEVVGEAGDGRAAIARAQELLPDIVVMDVSMPHLNGLKATEKLKAICPQVNVLALTRHTDDAYLQQLLRAGASGYVLKQSPPAELLHAIRAIVAGGKYLDPAVAGKLIGSHVGRSASTRVATQGILSDREAEILRLIAWGHSNKEIAARMEISVKTVEAHKANAMKRLDMHSRIDIVRFALLQGWLQDT
ncbi:MAG TPA: response regulator transcription factor [Pyrinomonadaceae bacterium]|jgi:DNA-binding NarL/FixJ family response regulator|nr:response regulator transcription factor [Pyrinomonadaceae bacterium]